MKRFITALAAMAVAFVSCQEKEDFGSAKIEINPQALEFGAEAESKTITLTATREWQAQDIPDWVTVTPPSGKASLDPQTITVSVLKNAEYDLEGEVTFTIGTLSTTLAISQKGEKGDGTITIQEFLNKKDTENAYRIKGTVKGLTNSSFKGFNLEDETGEISCAFPANFDDWVNKMSNGGTAVVEGKYNEHNGNGQLYQGTIISFKAGEGGEEGGGEIPENPTLTAIKDVFDQYQGSNVTLGSEVYVKGVVISNNDLNNMTSKMNMYIQDENGGIQIRFDYEHPLCEKVNNVQTHPFKFGDEIILNLSGATLSSYEGSVQINNFTGAVKTVETGKTVTPKQVSLADFVANKYYAQYVEIQDIVQVHAKDLDKNWSNSTADHTKINIEAEDGTKTIVFTSKFGAGLGKVAQGSGKIKGISTGNNEDGKYVVNLTFAQATDADALTGARFGNDNWFEIDNEGPIAAAPTADKIEINEDANVGWTATSSDATNFAVSPASGNGAGKVTITCTANEGEARSATITISTTAEVSKKSYEITVNQAEKVVGEEIKMDFTGWGFPGYSEKDWTTSYIKHTVTYTNAVVEFEGANKQNTGATISDMPVTKGKPITVKATDKTIVAVDCTFKQWGSKKQTASLFASTDGGTTFGTTAIAASDDFTLTSYALPEGTNAVKVTFSSSDNQIGIASINLIVK